MRARRENSQIHNFQAKRSKKGKTFFDFLFFSVFPTYLAASTGIFLVTIVISVICLQCHKIVLYLQCQSLKQMKWSEFKRLAIKKGWKLDRKEAVMTSIEKMEESMC